MNILDLLNKQFRIKNHISIKDLSSLKVIIFDKKLFIYTYSDREYELKLKEVAAKKSNRSTFFDTIIKEYLENKCYDNFKYEDDNLRFSINLESNKDIQLKNILINFYNNLLERSKSDIYYNNSKPDLYRKYTNSILAYLLDYFKVNYKTDISKLYKHIRDNMSGVEIQTYKNLFYINILISKLVPFNPYKSQLCFLINNNFKNQRIIEDSGLSYLTPIVIPSDRRFSNHLLFCFTHRYYFSKDYYIDPSSGNKINMVDFDKYSYYYLFETAFIFNQYKLQNRKKSEEYFIYEDPELRNIGYYLNVNDFEDLPIIKNIPCLHIKSLNDPKLILR